MDIKVLGSGCPECDTLYANASEAARELGIDQPVEKVEDLAQLLLLGVMQVPALMVDGEILSAGRVLSAQKIVKMLKK